MIKEQSNGWGAYQNKKKEIQQLKKQIVVQELNNYGEIVSIDTNNNFKHVSKNINPFRFPNKIKNEDVIHFVIEESKETKLEFSEEFSDEVSEEISDEVLEEVLPDISEEINIYKQKLSKNITTINNIISENNKNKKELEDKIRELTKLYEGILCSNNIKINKLQKYNKTIEEMIKIKINLLEIENDIQSNDSNMFLSCNYNKINCGDVYNNINSDKVYDDNSDIIPVSEEKSIIYIMKNAFNKQQETIHNFIPKIKDYSNTTIIVDNTKYLLIKSKCEYKNSYLTYKLSDNKSNYNQTIKKCCYCYRKLRWSVVDGSWVDIHCDICDKIIIDFGTRIVYNNNVFTTDKIEWSKQLMFNTEISLDPNCYGNLNHSSNQTGFNFLIAESLSIRIEKKKEEIYLNDKCEFIYWLYVNGDYIYIRGDYFKHILDDKWYVSYFKELPTVKYNEQVLSVEKVSIDNNMVFYKCKINDIFLIF